MDQAELVRGLEAGEDLTRHVDGLFDRILPPSPKVLAQGAALESLHHIERTPIGGAREIRHVHDVGVGERRQRLRLDAHAIRRARVLGEFEAEHLGDHDATHDLVFHLVHLPHPAGAELPRDAIRSAAEMDRDRS